MSKYLKPDVIYSEDLSEGIYANSGSSKTSQSTQPTSAMSGTAVKKAENFWNANDGQITYGVNLTGIDGKNHIRVVFHASSDCTGAWGGNAAVSKSGNDFIFDIWNPTSSFDATFSAVSKSASVDSTLEVSALK